MASKTSNKAKLNYIVDLIIMVGFVLAAVSGLILLFAGHGGYQGGRNPHFLREVLFFSRSTWRALHDWGGVAMIGGVVVHLALHWKWIVCMTRNLLQPRKLREQSSPRRRAPQCEPVES